jgi:hypothetical protein
MNSEMKAELMTFIQYFALAIFSLICAEVTGFLITLNNDVGDINFIGYFRKNFDGRLFWMSVFFLNIGMLRLFILTTSKKKKTEKREGDH